VKKWLIVKNGKNHQGLLQAIILWLTPLHVPVLLATG
jgi:hypothetical protein